MSDRDELYLAARNDFLLFFQLMHPHMGSNDAYEYNWSQAAVAHQLDLIERGDQKRLIINLPPRMLKSLMTSVAWPAYLLGHNPRLELMCISYGDELAGDFAGKCRALMMSDQYRSIFPRTALSGDRQAKHDFRTTAGGGRYSVAMGGVITGRGADIMIIDDPQKAFEAESEAGRKRTIDYYRGTLATRLNNRKTGRMILVQQRVHVDDLTGYLLGAENWPLLKLPARNEDGERVIELGHGHKHVWPDSGLLHPERDDDEVLAAAFRQVGPHGFAAQFQQDPQPQDLNPIKRSHFARYRELPPPAHGQLVVQSWDLAFGDGKENDYTVCLTALTDKTNVYIIDMMHRRIDYPEQRRLYSELAKQHRAKRVLVERSANGHALLADLRKLNTLGVPAPTGITPRGDKRARVEIHLPKLERHEVFLPERAAWVEEFLTEVCGFPFARHDDIVDALSQLLYWHAFRRNENTAVGGSFLISGPPRESYDLE